MHCNDTSSPRHLIYHNFVILSKVPLDCFQAFTPAPEGRCLPIFSGDEGFQASLFAFVPTVNRDGTSKVFTGHFTRAASLLTHSGIMTQ